MRITDLALRLLGATSGEQIIKAAASASGAITLPAGTTDFSSTGGASQVVKQTTAGGPFTVAQLAASDVTGALTGNQTITLSGDIAGSGATAITTTLPVVNSNVGTFQGIAVNAKGQVTAAANQSYLTSTGVSGMTAGQIPIAATATTITSSGNLSGAVTTAGSLATTLANNAVATAHITNANVTYAKIQNVAANRLLGNSTGSAATVGEIALPLAVALGGTNATTAAAALTSLGAAPLVSPSFTGNVTFAGNYLYQNGATGVVGSTGGPLIYSDLNSTALKLGSGNVSFLFQTYAGTSIATITGGGDLTMAGQLYATGRQTRTGTAGPNTGHTFNIDWTGVANLWVDTVNAGTIAFTSDYRYKDDIHPLPSTWDRVKTLRPISYTIKGAPELLIPEDPERKENWGFVAHELQETLIEAASSGYKDVPDTVQSPNPWVILAALTKTLQEAMARIEALEGRSGPPPDPPAHPNGAKLIHAMVWPVLILLSLVIVSSIGLVAVALFAHIEPTSTIAKMVGEGRSLTRLAAIVIIVPSLVVLTILDKLLGEVAATALSAIAGYVLGASAGQQ